LSQRYFQTRVVKDVLKVIEGYMDAYLGGQDIPIDHDLLVDLAEAIASHEHYNVHMRCARRIFGPSRGDRHYGHILSRIYREPGLYRRIGAARRPPPEIDRTQTSFQAPSITEQDLNNADDLTHYLNLLRLEVAIGGRQWRPEERASLREEVEKLFDLGRSDADITRVPEVLRDKVKGMLIDDVRSKADFEAALIRIGTVSSEEGDTFSPNETIDALNLLMARGGALSSLPMAHGIRAKTLQFLLDAGAVLTMQDGEPVVVYRKVPG
jgi:hypothetical protein